MTNTTRCGDCRARDLASGDTYTCPECGEHWTLFRDGYSIVWEFENARVAREAAEADAVERMKNTVPPPPPRAEAPTVSGGEE